ncbi:MAG TPA: hypothetical protein VHR35_14710 [Nocardioides sp.]|nr:hypothetical protein [Nocardioides sp.]
MNVRRAVGTALLCAAACVLPGCVEQQAAPSPSRSSSPSSTVPAAVPSYDAALPPARAVLALVPDGVTVLRLVDWDVVRRQVSLPALTSRSSAADRAAFRARAGIAAPALVRPLLESVDGRLRAAYGFGADDVAWEARWDAPHRNGWALSFRPGVDMAEVRSAALAGVGPLRHAVIEQGNRLAVRGPSNGGPVLGSDPRWARLVPGPGEAFVVRRGCVAAADLPAPSPRALALEPALESLAGFAVTFGDHVATVRTERGRTDLFTRVRVARAWHLDGTTFGRIFRHGVADPSSGRIGYDVPDPARPPPWSGRACSPSGCAPRPRSRPVA